MGTVAMRASAAPSAPMPQGAPPRTLLGLGKDALEMILSIVDDVRASRTCRDFRKATNALIQREWSAIRLQNFPHLQRLFSATPPANCGQLSAAVGAMQGQYPHITDALKTLRPSFSPRVFENSIQTESDRNLALIWPRIAEALHIPLNPITGDQIRASLRLNQALINSIDHLDLSGLELTMIPYEIASIALPNLRILDLSSNKLRALPNNFGSNLNNLACLCLDHNLLISLPHDFGLNWKQFRILRLDHNSLVTLPNNLGLNWNQLEDLTLQQNELTALPNNFGAHWPWWTQIIRAAVLTGNPILDATASPSQPNAPRHRLPTLTQAPQPLAPLLEKPSNALMNASLVNFAVTVALATLATYVIGWKIPATIGALYLGNRYMKGDLWAL